MKLQNIVYQSVDICMEEKLFFRKKGKQYCLFTDDKIIMGKGAKVDFSTYFNSFSAIKWFKYTKIDNVFLQLKVKGEFYITLIYKERLPEGYLSKIIKKKHYNTEGE